MQKPLDPLGFKQSRYERPNQDWTCGRAAEGRPCPLGPDKYGSCRATGQCIPARKGDRWFCTRSEAEGGKCDEGPLPNGECSHPISPCQPVRSLRRLREAVVWTVVALTTGSLLLLFGGTFRRIWLNPGKLTNAHATSAAKCSDCHSLDRGGHLSITAITSLGKRALADSALCLKCHSLGDHPLNPHGVAPVSLAALDQKLQKDAGSANGPVLLRVSRTIGKLDAHSEKMTCMTCHQEHHGRNFDLKRLSSAQCQTCHSVQFASLQSGHPEFSGYPYRQRTRVFFDHNSHVQQHFTEMKDKAPGSCQDCHVTDPSGRFMQVKNFSATCAACHGAQIQGEGMTVKGIAFFTVPGLDVDTLAAKGISVGEWPKLADGNITPFMELLLSREPATREALQKLHGVDLLDLSKASPDQLAAAEQLAWGVKNLLFNLLVEGQAYLFEQIKSQMSAASESISAGLAGQMSRAILLMAQEEWMPNLLTEIANYRKGIKPLLAERAKSTPAPSPSKKTAAAPSTKEAKPSGDDLLTGEKESPATSASPTPSSPSSKNDDLTSADILEPSADKKGASTTATPSAAGTAPPVEPKQGEEWTTAGGWYRSQGGFTLFYRPSGHADAFLVAWLTAAAQMERNDSWARDVFQKLVDPQAPGVCMKCHTADKIGETVVVNWLPAHRESDAHPFTTFKHTSHFSLTGDKGCQTCHTLNPGSDYAKYFTGDTGSEANRDPHRFQSNFKPLAKAVCVECHKPKVAGDACLLCHQYHTGIFAAKLVGEGKIQRASVKTK